MTKIQLNRKIRLRAGAVIRHLLLAWLLAVTVEALVIRPRLGELSDLTRFSFPGTLVLTALLFAALLAAVPEWLGEKAERWMFPVVFSVLAAVSLRTSFTVPFFLACLLCLGILVLYGARGWNGSDIRAERSNQPAGGWIFITGVCALAFFLFVSGWTVCRVLRFASPTYDFGIFAQMFHSMKTTGLPTTTVERDGMLSHFAVHVSPVYYLMLPFYAVVPKPETLQVLQALVLASAVIPLWKIGRLHGLSPAFRTALCGLMLVFPAYAGGTSYDLHENAFLTPLLLWLFYGIDRKNGWITGIAAVLTLTVKEDAAVYVAVAALWLLLRGVLHREGKWSMTAGFLLLAGSLGWFLGATGYLASAGDGVMTYRYKNFMYDESGSLMTVIKAIIMCPMKAVFECVDPQKLKFLAQMLLPLACLPLLTRRYERYVLLIPFLLVNLMTDYQYQYDIFFQYTYGSAACLFYLTAVNLANLKHHRQKLLALTLAGILGITAFCSFVVPKGMSYMTHYRQYRDYYGELRTFLDRVPDDDPVATTTFFSVALSDREILYDIKYTTEDHLLECPWIVIDLKDTTSYKRYGNTPEEGLENFRRLLLDHGYHLTESYGTRAEIYRRG